MVEFLFCWFLLAVVANLLMHQDGDEVTLGDVIRYSLIAPFIVIVVSGSKLMEFLDNITIFKSK